MSNLQNNRISNFIKDVFFFVWTLLGILILVLAAIAIMGEGSWTENLNIAATQEQAPQQEQTSQPAQQPAQPTQEQLACVSDEVGQDRFSELQQGEQATQDEAVAIQTCLGG